MVKHNRVSIIPFLGMVVFNLIMSMGYLQPREPQCHKDWKWPARNTLSSLGILCLSMRWVIYKAPWQIVWRGIPAAMLHFRPFWMAVYCNTKFQGNKSMNIVICSIFATLGIIKAKTFKLTKYWIDSKFTITGLNIGKMWSLAAFSQKALIAFFPCGNPATKSAKVLRERYNWIRQDYIRYYMIRWAFGENLCSSSIPREIMGNSRDESSKYLW